MSSNVSRILGQAITHTTGLLTALQELKTAVDAPVEIAEPITELPKSNPVDLEGLRKTVEDLTGGQVNGITVVPLDHGADPPQAHSMPGGWVQPVHDRVEFRPFCGGNSIWEHLPRIVDYCLETGIVLELGSGCGDGSTHAIDLGLAASPFPEGQKIHIAVCDHPPATDWIPEKPYFWFIKGDTRNGDVIGQVEKLLTDELDGGDTVIRKPHIIYVDTTHRYPHLKEELEKYARFSGKHTLWLFHDVRLPMDPKDAAEGIPHMEQAIIEAVSEGGLFYETHDYRVLSEDCCGLGALIPKAGRFKAKKNDTPPTG